MARKLLKFVAKVHFKFKCRYKNQGEKMTHPIFKQITAILILAGLLCACAQKEIATRPRTDATKQETREEPVTSEPAIADESLRIQQLREQLTREKEAAAQAALVRFLTRNIYFDFKDAGLTPTAEQLAREKAEWLAGNPEVSVTIEGHCDLRGSEAYNQDLGQRRAVAVETFLKGLGIASSRMTWVSLGETAPVSQGQTEADHRKNRRVRFKIDLPKT